MIAVIGCIFYIALSGDFFDEKRYDYLGYLDDGVVLYILDLLVLGAYRAPALTVYRHDH